MWCGSDTGGEYFDETAETCQLCAAGMYREAWPPVTNKDVGRTVLIQGNDLQIDGESRAVTWHDTLHYNCTRKIQSVNETLKGLVRLVGGQGFQNPSWDQDSVDDAIVPEVPTSCLSCRNQAGYQDAPGQILCKPCPDNSY